MFLSISGFAVLDEKKLRRRWKRIRRPYTKSKRRIHATDPYFEELRREIFSLIKTNDMTVVSVFQLVREIPYGYFDKHNMQFERVYVELLKHLLKELPLQEYVQVKIIIDARKHEGGVLGTYKFQQNIEKFLKKEFSATGCIFLMTPSYMDVLVELADFVSNTFYKAYLQENESAFHQPDYELVQIKNPL